MKFSDLGASSAAVWLTSIRGASFIGTCHRRMCGSMSVMWLTSATSIQQSPPLAPVTFDLTFDRSRRIPSLPPKNEKAGTLTRALTSTRWVVCFTSLPATGTRSPGAIGLLRAERPDLPPDLPSGFGDLTAELLSESPDDRPPDAETVLERLNEIRHASNVDALIAAGESDTVELKSSLHYPHGPLPSELRYPLEQGKLQPVQVRKEMQKRLNKEVTETIAAFLNTRGGTLLIGADDAGTTLGIGPDFEYCQKGKQNADGWMLSLKTVIINALGADVWSAIRVSLVPHREKMVAVILCPRRASQTWHYEDGGESFYIRTGNATTELRGRRLVGYISERWPV